MQFGAVIAILGFRFFFSGGSTSTKKAEKGGGKKPVVFGKQGAHTFSAPYQTYVRVRDQVFGSTPLLFKYCPVVPEAKTGKPTYPLDCLFPSLQLCCYSQNTSACWIVHSNQVCGVQSFHIKIYHRSRSRHHVVQMHGTIREDRTSPVNPTWTGHRMVCNLWQGVYYSSPYRHSDVPR